MLTSPSPPIPQSAQHLLPTILHHSALNSICCEKSPQEKMSDPFSVAAAAISLIDIGIKTTREISSLISSMRDAPEELIRLNNKVTAFGALLEQLHTLWHSYSRSSLLAANQQSLLQIHRTLQQSKKDLQELRDKLGEPIRPSDPRLLRFWKAIKFPSRESSFKKICGRLDHSSAFLTNLLSVIGR